MTDDSGHITTRYVDLDAHPDAAVRAEGQGQLLAISTTLIHGRTATVYDKVNKALAHDRPARIHLEVQRRAEKAFEEMPHT